MAVPFWKTEKFWRENARLGPAALARKYGDGVAWKSRRQWAQEEFGTELVLSLDHTGKVAERDTPERPDYEESVEILADGAYRSDKLLLMDAEQCKDREYLLRAHGFDPREWEIVNAKSAIWNVHSKQDGIQTLYSSRLTAKPLKSRFDVEEIVAALQVVKPLTFPRPTKPATGLLEVSPVDMHFGIATLDDYRDSLTSIVGIVNDRPRDEIVLPIGNDIFHNDNFDGTTANGTFVEVIDFTLAWEHAFTFYTSIIEPALKRAKRVRVVYVPDNHSRSMAWAFCKGLAIKYPQVDFDLELTPRKVHAYGRVCIGFAHGEQKVKDFDRLFKAEFPEFAAARVQEIHTAHEHHEESKDVFGVMQRKLPTDVPVDRWHRKQGYVGANKRFQVFEYSPDALDAIKYV